MGTTILVKLLLAPNLVAWGVNQFGLLLVMKIIGPEKIGPVCLVSLEMGVSGQPGTSREHTSMMYEIILNLSRQKRKRKVCSQDIPGPVLAFSSGRY